MTPLMPALLLLLGFECSSDGKIDVDGDADTDTDSDSDTDTDTDTDTDCDDPPVGSAPGGPACVSDTLACNSSITDTTNGGNTDLLGGAYQSWFCTIATDSDYQGPERVFEFEHPGTGTVNFALSAPCESLDMIVVRWEDEADCPADGYSVRECEDAVSGSPREASVWHNEPSRYLVIIDGDQSSGAPFTLTATCP